MTGHLVEAGWGAEIGYPALQLDMLGEEVLGFVFTSDELAEHGKRLDEFEGHEYRRVVATVTLDTGETVPAHLHVLSSPNSGE